MVKVILFLGRILLEVLKFWLVVVLYRLITLAGTLAWNFLKAAWALATKKV